MTVDVEFKEEEKVCMQPCTRAACVVNARCMLSFQTKPVYVHVLRWSSYELLYDVVKFPLISLQMCLLCS